MLFLMLFFVVLCSPWFFSPWYYCSQWFSLCVFFSIIIIIIIPIGVPSCVPHDGSPPCVFPQCCSFEFHHVTRMMMMMMMMMFLMCTSSHYVSHMLSMMFPIVFLMCSQYVPNMFFCSPTHIKSFFLFSTHMGWLYRPNENVFNTIFLLLIFFFCIFFYLKISF